MSLIQRTPPFIRYLLIPIFAMGALLTFRAIAPAAPTFHRDVAPILQAKCQDCHRNNGLNLGGMVAPMAFTEYEESAYWGAAMQVAVETGKMPPWHASSEQRGKFENERFITDEEIETIRCWVEAGLPEGSHKNTLATRKPLEDVTGEWSIGEPDLVIQFPEPYLVGDDVQDEYVDIDVPIPADLMSDNRWIKAVEFQPGSEVVHHIVAGGGLGGIAPGYGPRVYPDGYSRLLRAETVVSFQMHYHKTPGEGTAVTDLSKAGIVFYKPGDEIRHVIETESLGLWRFMIPAGDPNYCYDRNYMVEKDMKLLWFNPHMHLRGKSALYEARFPDGREETLLDVPNYDFNWQHFYDLKEPIVAPEGTEIYFKLCWDNSATNPSNPDPTRNVTWGRPTTDEMGFGFMSLSEVEPRSIIVGQPLPGDLPPPRPMFQRGDR